MYNLYAFILGDGHVNRGGSISITHSVEQLDYALYKQKLLTTLGCKTTSYMRSARDFHDKNTGKLYRSKESICVYTSSTFLGKELRKRFYTDRKIVPESISLTPEDWSIIFMDDGNKNIISHYNSIKNGQRIRTEISPVINKYRIYTQSFSEDENKILQKSLRDYDIDTSLESTKGGFGKYIVVRQKQAKQRFADLLIPFVISSMTYKLNIDC